MANSLGDQLLKAGLADAKQAAKVKRSKHQARKQAKGQGKGKQRGADEDGAAAAASRARHEQAERDRELNRQRDEAARQRARLSEAKQLVEGHRVEMRVTDVAYQFVDGDAVRKIWIDAAAQRGLAAGTMAIVTLDDRHEVVSREAALRIRERDPQLVTVLHEPTDQDRPGAPGEGDDAYADYEVPDDLMW